MVQRQKLELEINKPVELEILFNNPVSGENQYGVYNLYAVKTSDGAEYAFFPPREVHESLKKLNAGDRAVVTKSATQRGNKMVATYDVEVDEKTNNNTSEDKSIKSATETKNCGVSDNYARVMLQSLRDGLDISSEISGLSLDHIIRISLSLFIQRTRNGSNK